MLFRNKTARTRGSSLGVRTSVRCLEWFSETVNLRTFYKSMTTVFRQSLNICSAVSLVCGNGLKVTHSRQDELPKRKFSLSFISKLNPCRKHPAQDKIQMNLWTQKHQCHLLKVLLLTTNWNFAGTLQVGICLSLPMTLLMSSVLPTLSLSNPSQCYPVPHHISQNSAE